MISELEKVTFKKCLNFAISGNSSQRSGMYLGSSLIHFRACIKNGIPKTKGELIFYSVLLL